MMNKQVRDPTRPLRALVAKRLSRLTDASTHIQTETESIEDFCARKGITIVHATEDLDVSGGMPIKDRPGVGQYLADEYLGDWDVLIVYKLDRGFRSHYDFVSWFHEFVDGHGKQLISVGEEGLDMSTSMGRMFAGLLVTFAEWELTRMRERRADAQDVIRAAARWGGGGFGFGYEPYRDGPYWFLRPHPLYAAETQAMADAIVGGKSPGRVAQDLNDRGIPTSRDVQAAWSGRPRGGKQTEEQKAKGEQPEPYKWTGTAVIDHLRSELIRGYVLHRVEGQPPVRALDSAGEYVRREPLISDETWYAVQAALDGVARPLSGVRSKGSMLLRVAFCGYCGEPLYQNSSRQRKTDGNGRNHYYTCASASAQDTRRADQRREKHWSASIRRELLEAIVSDELLKEVGDVELTTSRFIPGDDHQVTLKQIGTKIANLVTDHFVHGGVADFDVKKKILEDEYDRVRGLRPTPGRTKLDPAGVTFGEKWTAMDADERHALLINNAVKVSVRKDDQGDDNEPPTGDRVCVRDGWRVTIDLGQLAVWGPVEEDWDWEEDA